MALIRVHDKTFTPYLTEKEIHEKLQQLAAQLNADYAGKRPLFIAVLNGSFMFASDLFKYLTIDAEICFIKLASYKGTKSTGHVITAIGLDTDITNRDVIILEDIIDTGKTLSQFLPQITNQQPASLKVAVLLHKPEATQFHVPIDYLCFSIPNKFVVGYGLDYDGLGRNIREIYQLYSD
ncbi:hypoxanthine phosphoribosyltransferase [Filimonas lacunae]|uniref:Hypoxanthine phosphoribosyltransferase n=1 Tax=Filimonas lacunae TaxID=477680 RepID=A0A173MMF4_9BACT|nr:hypoxanthine phosphoribosyltransferase [Filimonas lacunae]BAV08581.1 hypoxanthine-guanine phosphoribosyltransferase [Filimonas lacunae]SIS57660.1 hypoxanthine phosphoribosyltransferase [Filimonas lacunae]